MLARRRPEGRFSAYSERVRKVLPLALLGVLAVAILVARGGSAASGPTYNRDVAPILDAKCASCHRLGGIAPFALTTAAEAKAHAAGIVRMTKAGLMPPWMPGRRLGRDRRPRRAPAHPGRAVDACPLGGGRRTGRATRPTGTRPRRGRQRSPGRAGRSPSRRARPTCRTRPAAGSTTTTASCSIPKLKQDAFVTGALIRPQRTGIVHHVILYEAAGAQATAATQMNAASGGKGWTCFGGPGLPFDLTGSSALTRLGQPPWIAAWVPGHTTNALPERHGRAAARGREDRHAGALQPDRGRRPGPLLARSCGCGPPRRR